MENDIKVVVADDSGLMRLIISDILNEEPGIRVINTAVDGKDAVTKVLEQDVDVLVLDMNMGDYSGTYAVEHILKKKNVPILILSALGNTNMEPVMDALRLGAIDYINKPDGNKTKVREIGKDLVRKVKAVAKSNREYINTCKQPIKSNHSLHTFPKDLKYDILVVGASTGGPPAIEKIISNLPANFPIPIIIAQHMPANFVVSFASRLNVLTPLNVVVGSRNERVEAGKVIIASGETNTILKKNESGKVVIDFSDKRFTEFNNPSINSLFFSAAEIYGGRIIASVLTGMGKDGADGMEFIYNKKGYTIAQNKETSAVYGMPREVAERGVVQRAVSIDEMAGFIVSCLTD